MTSTADRQFDCAVIGAGPAGAALAITLSGFGRRVALIDRGDRQATFPEETVVAGAAPLLARIGGMASVRARDFRGLPRHGVCWGDGITNFRKFDEAERGFKIDRKLFDADLLAAAQGVGVTVFSGYEAEGPIPTHGRLELRRKSGERSSIDTKVNVIAAGKTTGGRLIDLELEAALPATTALAAIIDSARALPDATLIESVPEGWLWWLPLRDGKASLTLFADAAEVHASGAINVFRSALRSADGPARGAELRPTFGLVATPRLLRPKSDVILIGDAASTIDPLSSQGLEKAIGSGEEAAIVVNTILEVPEVRDAVCRYHERWESALFWSHGARATSYYRRELRFSDRPFWEKRHNAMPTEFEKPRPKELPTELRRSDHLRPRATFRRRGRLLEPTVGWSLGESPEIVESLGGMPIQPLIEILAEPRTPRDIFRAAAADGRLAYFSEKSVFEALTELLRRNMIEPSL